MPPTKEPQLVQPDPNNPQEMGLAIAISDALNGRSLITSAYGHQLNIRQKLTEGLLVNVRPEFRDNVLAVVVPMLDATEFQGPVCGDPKTKRDFAEMQMNNARELAKALRAATGQTTTATMEGAAQ